MQPAPPVNSPYAPHFKSGAMWNWHHDGTDGPANGQIECTDSHKVRWCGGHEHGLWRFQEADKVRIDFNNVRHILMKSKENEDWVLITPQRDPPSIMRSCEPPIE